ncbi:LiPIN (Mammalian lipodystrophy associated) [Trichostrongylus colubriformis]|uniref:LiPIN (Mammalian lipodystrophy associated) n=1 Tax=Trichostrongylus colubriformis TaxID=6319 RepID=A0AAN8IWJ5_TRICO
MDYAYRVLKNVKYFYNTINPATLSGAIDVIVVEQPDGELKSTPFHVRFGKYGVFSHSDKYVDIQVNGEEIDLKMKLGESGVAFFVEEADPHQTPSYMLTSPLPEPGITPTQSTVEVLTESAKILSEKKAETETDRNSATTGGKSPEQARTKESQEPKQEQSLLEVQQTVQRKRNLPFNSSVFSIRKNRSLPDLQSLADEKSGYHSDVEGKSAESWKTLSSRPLKHSKSQAFDKSLKRKGSVDSVAVPTKPTKPQTQRRKKSRVAFQPISIKIENESSDSECSTVSSSPAHSLLDSRDVDRIADGALSDSEVDRHRNTPEPHASDVTDWKWGELPETRDNKLKQEQNKAKDASKPKGESSGWTWFPWGHRSSPADAPPKEEGISLDELFSPNAASDPSKIEKYLGKASSTAVSIDSGHASRGTSQPSSPAARSDDSNFADKTPTQETTPVVEHSENPRTRNASDQRSASSNEDIFPLSEDESDDPRLSSSGPSYMLSLRLSSEKLRSLGLVYGANECRFSITTKFQGTSWCSCNIYLYKWYERIVISDIDGTITKSDVLGHVIPAIGGTWAHAGVAELYTRIKNNGYKMVYLSSRAIGQSHTTKQYLKSIAQDSKQLPDGPVLLSPTSVLIAFRREVIERRPEEFKIAALTDLKNLFPVKQPFFAGFGNRETDVTSYRAVGIMPARILIIDPSGRVRRSDSVGYVSSYLSMATETVDYLFPPLTKKARRENDVRVEPLQPTWTNPLECSSFTHWKQERDESFSDTDLAAYEANRRKFSEEKTKRK